MLDIGIKLSVINDLLLKAEDFREIPWKWTKDPGGYDKSVQVYILSIILCFAVGPSNILNCAHEFYSN